MMEPEGENFMAVIYAEARERERQEATAKLAAANLIRAVIAAPDAELPAAVAVAKQRLMGCAPVTGQIHQTAGEARA